MQNKNEKAVAVEPIVKPFFITAIKEFFKLIGICFLCMLPGMVVMTYFKIFTLWMLPAFWGGVVYKYFVDRQKV